MIRSSLSSRIGAQGEHGHRMITRPYDDVRLGGHRVCRALPLRGARNDRDHFPFFTVVRLRVLVGARRVVEVLA